MLSFDPLAKVPPVGMDWIYSRRIIEFESTQMLVRNIIECVNSTETNADDLYSHQSLTFDRVSLKRASNALSTQFDFAQRWILFHPPVV